MGNFIYQLGILGLLAVFALVWKLVFHKKRHAWYIKRAAAVYKNLTEDSLTEPQIIQYLRHVNPYVFEELLLLSFEKRGYKVVRNARYSGDGGVDGHVVIDGQKIPIQAKRYSAHIRLGHVIQFSELVAKRKVPFGFFIHTGRTGKGCRNEDLIKNVRVISGKYLIDFIKRNPLPYLKD